jgi:hypothetical protein
MRSDLKHEKMSRMNKIKSVTTLGDAGSHRKSPRLRANSPHKLLATGQIRTHRSKKAAARTGMKKPPAGWSSTSFS